MDLGEYLGILLARWRVVVATTILGGMVAVGLSQLATPQYVARTTVFFAVTAGETPRDLNRGGSYARALVGSYAEVTSEPVVTATVIRDLRLATTPRELATRISARAPQDTSLVQISVTDSSPRRSAEIADALATRLAEVVPTLTPRSDRTPVPVAVTTVTPASVPNFASAPKTRLNGLFGLIAGAVLGLGLAVLRHRIDVRISETDAVRVTGAPVIGSIRPELPYGQGRLAALLGRARDPAGDVEQLRTAVQHIRLHGGYRTVVITAPDDGTLSASTALELGRSLSRAGTQVLLVDADLDNPNLTRSAGAADAPGLSTVLAEGRPWQLAAVEHGSPAVTVLGAGPAPFDPDLLLETRSTDSVLRRTARHFDMVVVSAPPVLRIADTLLLSRIADGVVLVADRRRTNRDALAESHAALKVVGARVLGIVLRG